MIKHLVQVLIQKEILDKEYRAEYEYVLVNQYKGWYLLFLLQACDRQQEDSTQKVFLGVCLVLY